jgi:diguanylate cyclase (GGDEF)-like protein
MSKIAWLYVWIVLLSGAILIALGLARIDRVVQPWTIFLLLTGLASAGQLFKAEAPNHQLYHPTLMFVFAGVLLLQPGWFVLLVLVAHLAEWGKELMVKSEHLRAWYLQPFNISSHLASGLAAGLVFRSINPSPEALTGPAAIGGAMLGALAYTLINHLMVGEALALARGVSFRESRIMSIENLSTDFVMLAMGFIIANLVALNPWLVIPALTPLYLIYRALAVPILKQQANTDPKTGLWNVAYFRQALEAEVSRACRFERSLTVIMADLDFLRNINNAYGHLAGDAVLVGVSKILRENFREYDTIARFGGEEFAILMPETSPEQAYPRIEIAREAVARAVFEAPVTHACIRATMSFGLAGLSVYNRSVKEIIHCADVAVYQAKLQGRNRTKIYTDGLALSLGIQRFEDIELGV